MLHGGGVWKRRRRKTLAKWTGHRWVPGEAEGKRMREGRDKGKGKGHGRKTM